MPRIRIRTAATAVAIAALVALPMTAQADDTYGRSNSRAGGDRLYAVGLTADGTALVGFTTDKPRNAKSLGAVSGLAGDTRLVGIDYRVQDGQLYGVGNAGGIYVISDTSAAGQKVQQLTQPLDGARFGVDFNPVANALRIVSDTGQNLRQPFAGALAGVTQTDTRLSYGSATATGVTGAAYTNNDLDPGTATTLFDLDTTLDQIAVQSPANSGQLVATGTLGVDAAPAAGFDIYSRLRDGRTVSVDGYAALTVAGTSSLYSVELLTGQARRIGTFPVAVTDIAIDLDQH